MNVQQLYNIGQRGNTKFSIQLSSKALLRSPIKITRNECKVHIKWEAKCKRKKSERVRRGNINIYKPDDYIILKHCWTKLEILALLDCIALPINIDQHS